MSWGSDFDRVQGTSGYKRVQLYQGERRVWGTTGYTPLRGVPAVPEHRAKKAYPIGKTLRWGVLLNF